MDELSELRAKLRQAEERQKATEKSLHEERRRREEEQRRREEVERMLADQTLGPFLAQCHELNKLVGPITINVTPVGIQGETGNPISRLYPQHILPWEHFSASQSEVWGRYDERLWSIRAYPSVSIMDYLKQDIDPIGSEDELQLLQHSTVENHVTKMFKVIIQDDELRHNLPRAGRIAFENQAAFRQLELTPLDNVTASLSVSDNSRQRRNTRADQFCVLWGEDGSAQPLLAIEYKPPHKLTIQQICMGLQSEIHTDSDILSEVKDEDAGTLEYQCRRLLAAVITQLFSCMIDKGVQYGYVCTGEAFIFVKIPTDPTTLYYSVNIPKKDWDADEQHQLKRAAVSQVFAFVQQALSATPPTRAWIHEAKSQLKRWKVEYIDILRMIPETERKSRDASAYQPTKWTSQNIRKPPIALRTRSGPPQQGPLPRRDEHDAENEGEATPQESPTPQTRSRAKARQGGNSPGGGKQGTGKQSGGTQRSHVPIQQRPYCTHQCLLALCQGRRADPFCPNIADHGTKLPPKNFLQEIKRQLEDETNNDCCPLYIHGACGAMLKIRSSSRGYTFVAKAVDKQKEAVLRHEANIYDQLQSIQGQLIPVCCGFTKFDIPFHYDGSELTSVLLMSWAGVSLTSLMRDTERYARISGKCEQLVKDALEKIGQRDVVHGDAEARNFLYDEQANRLMIVDFEKSQILHRQPLGELSLNRKWKPIRDARSPLEKCLVSEG